MSTEIAKQSYNGEELPLGRPILRLVAPASEIVLEHTKFRPSLAGGILLLHTGVTLEVTSEQREQYLAGVAEYGEPIAETGVISILYPSERVWGPADPNQND
jgi:hypothetical protein